MSEDKSMEIPLIDRAVFFDNPEIAAGKLSPDGTMISFLKPYQGILNVWVKTLDADMEEAAPVTASKRPLSGYFWSRDGKYIVYALDRDGDENINIYAVDPHESNDDERVPGSRNLTPFESISARIYQAAWTDPDLFYVGINDRDPAWHDLYSLRLSDGKLERVYTNTDRITGYIFDWKDELRGFYRTNAEGTTRVLYKKSHDLKTIFEVPVTEMVSVVGWTPDNENMYIITNEGRRDLMALALLDPRRAVVEDVESDPKGRVDLDDVHFDQNTREMIATSYVDDRERIYWKSEVWEKNYTLLKERFPDREVSFQSSNKEYSRFLISVSGDRFAASTWLFVPDRDILDHVYTARPRLADVEEWLAPMEGIRYPSRDGMEIPGFVTLPREKTKSSHPLVVLVHGGPKGPRDYWGYHPLVQFLANRGYAVLQPNFRASGGYGKEFLNAGDMQWGRLMQDDITFGVHYLIEKGLADPDRIAIMGGSYGGYATLAGLAFTPELYACGVDIVGPSNLFTLLDSIPPYWEAGRAFLYGMVGDPETQEGRERIREASPLFFVDEIKKPLLIVQGANDPRVKQAESDQIVQALVDKEKHVAYLLAEDEGHGFRKPINRMAMYAAIEQFLADELGGRYQKEKPEAVAQRLSELLVDVEKVKLAEDE